LTPPPPPSTSLKKFLSTNPQTQTGGSKSISTTPITNQPTDSQRVRIMAYEPTITATAAAVGALHATPQHPLSEPELPEFAGFPECRGVLHTPNILGECNSPLRNHRGYRGSDSLKSEFLRNSEHIFVKGADTYFASAVFLAYVKCRSYVNCIQTFAFGKSIILLHSICKIFSYIVKKYFTQKFFTQCFFFIKPIYPEFISALSIKFKQRNIGFNFKQYGRNFHRIAFPNVNGFILPIFIQQNGEKQRRIKVSKHLKSVSPAFFVNLPPILCFYSIIIFWNNGCPRSPLRQSSPARFGFLNHPFNKTCFFLAIHRKHNPIAEVYKPAARLGGLRFLNSGRLHSKNIEKKFPFHNHQPQQKEYHHEHT